MAVSFHISAHACQRFVERVNPKLTLAEAHAEIEAHARAIEAALSLGCKCVRLGNHARLILDGPRVVTVYPAPPKATYRQGNRCAFGATRRKWNDKQAGERDNG